MNSKLPVLLYFGSLFAHGNFAHAIPASPPEQSTVISPLFLPTKVKAYSYSPVDERFWKKIESDLDKNPEAVVTAGAKRSDQFGESSMDGAEGRLALGRGLMAKGLSYAAHLTFEDLAKSRAGTAVGEAALFYLSNLAQEKIVDESALEGLLTGHEFARLHPEIQSFVSYYRYLYNLKLGFNKWAENERVQIQSPSFWSYQLRYWTALSEIAAERIDEAESSLKALAEDLLAPEKIRSWSRLQLARISFERGQFESADRLYSEVGDLGLREKGRILLEMAWTKYYLKDYSKSLGLLAALRSPYFTPSLNPERHVLEMIIYRELCQYKLVNSAVLRFRSDFKDSIRSIKLRKPLRDDPVLLNFALLDRDVQDRANLISQLHREAEEFNQAGFKGLSFIAGIKEAYKLKDQMLQKQIDLTIEPKVRIGAEKILDVDEQVQFLDYTSKLDALRLSSPNEDRTYKAEDVSYITFEKIFWPVKTEFWRDEFDDFNVLLSSRCDQPFLPRNSKLEKAFK